MNVNSEALERCLAVSISNKLPDNALAASMDYTLSSKVLKTLFQI